MLLLPSLNILQLIKEAGEYNSIYFSKVSAFNLHTKSENSLLQGSLESALLACGSLLELTGAVLAGQVRATACEFGCAGQSARACAGRDSHAAA